MIRQTPPDNSTITDLAITEWIYELQGRLDKICEVPSAGTCTSPSRTVDLSHDALGRTTSEASSGTGLTSVTTTTTYGVDGQPTSVGSGGATRTLTYETSSGLLDQVKEGTTVLTDYAWSADGTLASRLDDGVGTASFAYDWADRLTGVTPPSGLGYTNTISQAWRLDGLLASTTYGNNEVATVGYDEAKRPERIDLTSNRWLSRAYDRAGNVTSDDRSLGGGIGSPAGSGELVFTYDGLGRVTNTTLGGAAQASYTYDRSSNRTSKTENGSTFLFTFDATDVLATQKKDAGAVEAFVYDTAGNLTREWTAGATYRTNTWDAANRLRTIAPASGPAAVLTYDPLGRIATRKVGTAPTDYHAYAGTSDVLVSRDSIATTTTYLATPSGARMGTSNGTTAQWLLYDLLGSVVASEGMANTSIVDALRYDAYGQTLGEYQTTGTDLGVRFRGLIDLAPTADPDVAGNGSDPLYQMGARAYAPHLGTFTKLDTYAGTAQDPISLNRYLYAHANPATLIDPTGHSVQQGPCGPDSQACDEGGFNPNGSPQYQNPNAPVIEPVTGGGGTSSTGGQDAGGATIIVIPTTPVGPQPAPPPCGGPSGIPCPTRVPTAGVDGQLFDPVSAGLIACSIAAPPPGQFGCDVEQFHEAVEGGDPVDIVANGLGFIWYVGDGAKWIIKGGKAIFEPSQRSKDLRLLTSGKPASVDEAHLLDVEIPQAWDVANFRGGHFQGPDVPYKPGIDGWFEGVPVSLKSVSVPSPKSVLNEVKKARTRAAAAGYSGVDVYVSAGKIDIRSMSSFANHETWAALSRTGIINDIYIHVSDGWVIVKAGN